MNIYRYFHTLKHLKSIQIRYQLWYRIRSKMGVSRSYEEKKVNYVSDLYFSPYIEKAFSLSNNKFTFLNIDYTFSENIIDWNFIEYGKLWAYNLNYMDYLLQSGMQKNIGIELIVQFIDNFSSNNEGKEPYPISLRGINWIKFLSKHKIQDNRIVSSLLKQYSVLNENIEYHLLGNHLLENGFSLLFGAFYFKNRPLYKKAKKILQKELDEQILTDGGHFELSPMYHQIILDRLLDSINLLQNNDCFNDQNNLLSLLEEKAELMLSWLKNMTFSNGHIPDFNDSTVDIAPSSNQLFSYAKTLNLNLSLNLKLSSSGYRIFKSETYQCIVDVGHIGPNYIPGHAHADMLSFVLNIMDEPIIVDTGISSYEKNNTRQLERSTCSHNTVSIENINQSDVWGGFRVGSRAQIKILNETNSIVEAEHNGYKPVIHRRRFEFKENSILIKDKVLNTNKLVQSYLHFHPEVKVNINDNIIHFGENYKIIVDNSANLKVEKYMYPLGFNKCIEASKLIINFSKTMEITLVIE